MKPSANDIVKMVYCGLRSIAESVLSGTVALQIVTVMARVRICQFVSMLIGVSLNRYLSVV